MTGICARATPTSDATNASIDTRDARRILVLLCQPDDVTFPSPIVATTTVAETGYLGRCSRLRRPDTKSTFRKQMSLRPARQRCRDVRRSESVLLTADRTQRLFIRRIDAVTDVRQGA